MEKSRRKVDFQKCKYNNSACENMWAESLQTFSFKIFEETPRQEIDCTNPQTKIQKC